MAILLNDKEKELARESFYNNKAKELCRKDESLTMENALLKARKDFKTIPERYYRERMKETQGLLVIYLFDSRYAFNQLGIEKYPKLKVQFENYVSQNDIDLTMPLVGYAIEFPPLKNDPGGTYMQGDYELDIDEGEDVDENEEIPNDLNDN